MRLTLFFMVGFLLVSNANSYSQNTRLDIKLKNGTIIELIKQVEENSEFVFLYKNEDLDLKKKLTVNLKDATIKQVMDLALKDQNLDYDVYERQIILRKSEANVILDSEVQQERTVTGVVTDQGGLPLPGVSVVVKGTTIGTVTNSNGEFSLRIPSAAGILQFSFVGLRTLEIALEGRSTFTVSMEEEAIGLEEVVAVGYGTQKKVNLTGAVSSITSEEIADVPAANVSTLLYGKLSGLIPTQRSGEPGADNVNLSIRGFSSPLIVVDGVPGRDFTRLDPNEIESITILKDAASAAVYGVSGGNGVVLVTTKKGNIGKPIFDYTMNYGVQSFANFPGVVNSEEFAILMNESAINRRGELKFSQEEIQKFRDGTDPNYPNFDYTDYMMHKYFPQLQQNISVRGGNENIKYFFLLGQTSQASVWKSDGNKEYSKYNFRSNIDAQIINNLNISVELGGRIEDRDDLINNSSNMFSWYLYQTPIARPRTPDGKISTHAYGLTAYLDRDLTGHFDDQRNYIEGALNVNYKIPFIKGLEVNVKGVLDKYFRDDKRWEKKYYTHTWNEETQTSIPVGTRGLDRLRIYNYKSSTVLIQSSLSYNRTFLDAHNVKALLLYEVSERKGTNLYASRTGYVLPLDQLFAGPDLGKDNTGGAWDDGREGYVGRLNYDYLGKYLFEYSFRYDGSAKFPPDYRWGFFPGVSIGWRLSEENFFSNNINAFDDLKLRGSWGTLGSDVTGNFQFLTGYTYPSRSYVYGADVVTAGMVSTGTPNPFITWEESQIFNLALDGSLWNRLLGFEFDVFYRKRDGLLATRVTQIPSTYGASLPSENINSDEARGFELFLDHYNSIGDIKYRLSSMISYSKLKNRHYEQRSFYDQYDNWRNNRSDRYARVLWGYKYIGQFQSLEEIYSSPIQDSRQNSTLLPGDLKYEDFNGDGVIDGNDVQPIGRGSEPELNFGFGINATWKRISLDMDLQGASLFNLQSLAGSVVDPFKWTHTAFDYFLDRWRLADTGKDPLDPDSKWIKGKYPPIREGGEANNRLASSWLLEPITYMRLKQLAISYSLGSNYLQRIGIQDIAISLSGQNLLTFSSMRESSMDPETTGARFTYYPQIKTYNIGLKIKF